MAEEFKLIQKSYDFCNWLMGHTNKFPKSHRFSIAARLENHFLEFLEHLVVANYRTVKLPLLQAADEQLVKIRLLVRLSHANKFINTGSYEFAANHLDEIGRMLGGWIKQQSGQKGVEPNARRASQQQQPRESAAASENLCS